MIAHAFYIAIFFGLGYFYKANQVKINEFIKRKLKKK